MTTPTPQILVCQRAGCGRSFERARRGAMPKHCPDCRIELRRERARLHVETQRAEIKAKRDTLRQILEPMRDFLSPAMIRTAEGFLADLAPDTDAAPIVQDKMPAGTSTPGGPDEGATSEFADLRDELDRRHMEAVMHDWHAEHPGWWRD